MSLFGEDDEDFASSKARPTSSALFDDSPAPRSSAALFGDDTEISKDVNSPWGFSAAQRATNRGSSYGVILNGSAIPEMYIDLFDALSSNGYGEHGKISLDGLSKLFSAANVSEIDRTRILDLTGSRALSRGEFNVLVALIGLSLEGEDVTLDGVDERRRSLPCPDMHNFISTLPQLANRRSSQSGAHTTPSQHVKGASTGRSREHRKSSFGLDADPWASPELHKSHKHSSEPPNTNHNGSNQNDPNGMGARTTSNFTTTASVTQQRARSDSSGVEDGSGEGWGNESSTVPSQYPALVGETALQPNQGSNAASGGSPSRPSFTSGVNRGATNGVEELVTVLALPDKEGIFLFQHRNYEVSSVRRGSKVVRRYSDFVWLLDCLHKRYPFRQLPLLPPKRVAINGNHLAADDAFLEKRRKGLVRFTNALVRHPVLVQEQLVIMFLTVPTELAVWRKQATISVQEEFTGKVLPPHLEDSLPVELEEMFDTVRAGVHRSCEIYINLCSTVERLARRNEGIANELGRCSHQLQSLTEVSAQTYAFDTNNVPLLNGGVLAVAKHLSQGQALLEDEAKAYDNGILEDLKRQRDGLVSVRDMFDRRDRYDKDDIPRLEKRVESNERKLESIRARPEATVKPGEKEKVEEAIFKDKQSIVAQHARSVFVKECIKDEILFFQGSQYHLSRLHQDWSQEQVKYAELQADNWRALSEQVEAMPLSD